MTADGWARAHLLPRSNRKIVRFAARAEAEAARGANRALDAALGRLKDALRPGSLSEAAARYLTETMALAREGSLLVRFAPQAGADAFCATRLGEQAGRTYGASGAAIDRDAILARIAARDAA